DLLWEMQGELGTSHAYERGGEYRWGPHYDQGFLGADWTFDSEAGGYRVARLVHGDPWDPDARSPLLGPGLDVRAGDLLLAINGQRLGEIGRASCRERGEVAVGGGAMRTER